MGEYKTNEILIYSDYAELIIFSRDKTKKHITLLDIEDISLIEKHSWCIRSRGYVGRVEKGKLILLHRQLCNCNEGHIVDHINKNKLDNRKDNLRISTFQNNIYNSSIKSNNTSGVTGVGFDVKSNKWRARISIDRKNTCLGFFNNKDDAIKVRLEAEKKYYGDYAPQEHIFKEYGILYF